jgi:hypothetical protein
MDAWKVDRMEMQRLRSSLAEVDDILREGLTVDDEDEEPLEENVAKKAKRSD